MNKISRTLLIAALGSALGFAGITGASASTWAKDHPRRVEVNHRLAHQDRRIDRDLAAGKITRHQAARLHAEDHAVRADERFDASFDHSHLTRAEKTSLNQDENGVSKQIHHDAH